MYEPLEKNTIDSRISLYTPHYIALIGQYFIYLIIILLIATCTRYVAYGTLMMSTMLIITRLCIQTSLALVFTCVKRIVWTLYNPAEQRLTIRYSLFIIPIISRHFHQIREIVIFTEQRYAYNIHLIDAQGTIHKIYLGDYAVFAKQLSEYGISVQYKAS